MRVQAALCVTSLNCRASVATPAIGNGFLPVAFTAATKSGLSHALIWPGRAM